MFHAGGDADADFFGAAFGVEGEEEGVDFVAGAVRPAVAQRPPQRPGNARPALA
jgi:hypothetical protein